MLDFRLSDVREGLGRDVSYTVANDHAVIRAAIDRGVPIDEIKRKSAIGKDLDTLDAGIAAALGLSAEHVECPQGPPHWSRARHGGSSRGPAARHHGDAGAFEKRGFQDRPQGRAATSGCSISSTRRSARPDVARANRAEVGDIVAEELGKQNHALNQVERKQLVADVLDELPRPWSDRAAAQGSDDYRHPGEWRQPRFRRALWHNRATPVRFTGRKAPSAHHPEDRLGGRTAGR